MSNYLTNEKNVLCIMSLLKAHNIRHVIASPGHTNTALVVSMQRDPYFKMYSAVDERSAAYMACGLSAEINEPVVISCTGATASRNYFPALTEAYYRKLPILAITSTQAVAKVGHLIAQVIDRSSIPKDVVNLSVELPIVKDSDDLWECEVKVNQALLALRKNGGGPAHINLPTTYSKPFETKTLPNHRKIDLITNRDFLPELHGKVAVFIGAHKKWDESTVRALERFCIKNDAVVFCDHTSGYKGKNRLLFSLAAAQTLSDIGSLKPDVFVHIGEISGDYTTLNMAGKEVWRVSEDGEIRDTFRRLRYVFNMPEQTFFESYSEGQPKNPTYFETCKEELESVRKNIQELPFSNIWLASKLAHRIPQGSTIHFGILNSLRSWNFFDLPSSVEAASNVGGFGIDGSISSVIGASLANEERLYFAVIGDLAFFYDMNAIGNRHIKSNLRFLLVNNGKGTEFRQYNAHGAYFGESADEYVAAAGHFGSKSTLLVKNLAENLGFEYISASSKDEFNSCYEQFVSSEMLEKPIIFEIFTDSELESKALETIQTLVSSPKGKTKDIAKKILGQKGINTVKQIIKR